MSDNAGNGEPRLSGMTEVIDWEGLADDLVMTNASGTRPIFIPLLVFAMRR
jgi:hypothetical protein